MPVSPSVANANGYNPGVFFPGLGFRVTKTEDVGAAGADLFVVTGMIAITSMVGEVTNEIGAAVNNYKLRIKTDNSDLCGQEDISTFAVGRLIALPPRASLNTQIGTTTKQLDYIDGAGGSPPMFKVIGTAGGTLTIQSNHTAGDSGDAIAWTLHYLPISANGSVAAA